MRKSLGKNDSILSINDVVYFTNEDVGIELPLRALLFDVSSEETLKKVLPQILSNSQMTIQDLNYQIGPETTVNFPKLKNPVKQLDIMENNDKSITNSAKEGTAYLIPVAVEGHTSTFAVLFVSNIFEKEYFEELSKLIISTTEIGGEN